MATKRPPKKGENIKTFEMETIESVLVMLQKRRDIAKQVVDALNNGGKAITSPNFENLSDIEKANRVYGNLASAAAFLAKACPNPLISTFVVDMSGVASKRPRKPRR